MVSLKCNFCNTSTFAVELKPHRDREEFKRNGHRNVDANGSKKVIVLGEKVCKQCRDNNFKDGKQEFTESNTTTSNETLSSQKSYIPLKDMDKQQYRDLRIRDLMSLYAHLEN